MTLFASIVRRTGPRSQEEMDAYKAAHQKVFGNCADVPTFLRSPKDDTLAAVVGEVHDLEEMRRISRTPEGDALMRKYGFLEQLDYFIEEA
ncbi:hypothetical protein [Yoonia litorea]|uniref:EthD domain-containing protein n=1 Tax=Yoonia litorea TaxID=1123755 RepID=A0A1I6ME33_9RHOB|nr:hypothetical protein [Yoonia litorea]SFS13883.1 hypothetical protein SAMN05444714_1618 [Yoonia litorea]